VICRHGELLCLTDNAPDCAVPYAQLPRDSPHAASPASIAAPTSGRPKNNLALCSRSLQTSLHALYDHAPFELRNNVQHLRTAQYQGRRLCPASTSRSLLRHGGRENRSAPGVNVGTHPYPIGSVEEPQKNRRKGEANLRQCDDDASYHGIIIILTTTPEAHDGHLD